LVANVGHHSKNKLPMTKDERNDVIEDIFGVDGLVSANDTVDFNMKSDNLCNTHPERINVCLPEVC
jgi:hypothetical protein